MLYTHIEFELKYMIIQKEISYRIIQMVSFIVIVFSLPIIYFISLLLCPISVTHGHTFVYVCEGIFLNNNNNGKNKEMNLSGFYGQADKCMNRLLCTNIFLCDDICDETFTRWPMILC